MGRARRTQTVVEAAHLVVRQHGHSRLTVVKVAVAVALERLFLHVRQQSLGTGRVVGIVRGLNGLGWRHRAVGASRGSGCLKVEGRGGAGVSQVTATVVGEGRGQRRGEVGG